LIAIIQNTKPLQGAFGASQHKSLGRRFIVGDAGIGIADTTAWLS
jgi:hypothetical protein